MASFSRKRKRGYRQYSSLAESHVPRFQERVGTCQPEYMIPVRLPWRHRARPSATLHEIPFTPKSELIFMMLHTRMRFVKRNPKYEVTVAFGLSP